MISMNYYVFLEILLLYTLTKRLHNDTTYCIRYMSF